MFHFVGERMHSCYNICMYSLQQRIHEFTDCFIDKYILCFISKGLVCVQVNNKKFSRQYIAEKLSRLALNTNLSINHEFTYPRFLLKAPKLESTNFIDFRVFLILRYLCLFVYCGVQHILCFAFVLFFFVLCTLPMLPVSLDCSIFKCPSVFSNINLIPVV
jgi:hypothetical protein